MRPDGTRMTLVRAGLLIGLLFCGSGCVVRSSMMRLGIAENHEAVIVIHGDKKSDVLVENLGPGPVNVTFKGQKKEMGPYDLSLANSQQHQVQGPARLLFWTNEEKPSIVQVTAVRCEGMSLEGDPIPRDPELEGGLQKSSARNVEE